MEKLFSIVTTFLVIALGGCFVSCSSDDSGDGDIVVTGPADIQKSEDGGYDVTFNAYINLDKLGSKPDKYEMGIMYDDEREEVEAYNEGSIHEKTTTKFYGKNQIKIDYHVSKSNKTIYYFAYLIADGRHYHGAVKSFTTPKD